MTVFLTALAVSFAVIFVAELGDKSQLMALTFATRYRAIPVLIGITIAAAVVHAVSVGVGFLLGASLPTFWISIVAAVVFIAFGFWTLRGEDMTVDEQPAAATTGRSAVVASSVAFILAELGDKTMLATITLATNYPGWSGALGVWAGSTLGMVLASGMAILVGRWLGRSLPERTIRIVAALLFFAFGIWLGVEALLTR